jgi:hypothetical protein
LADPVWQLANLSTLAHLYVLRPNFENSTAGAVVVITLASPFCLGERKSHNYVGWRPYTLYALMLQDSIFPTVSDHLYSAWPHPENRLQFHGTAFAHGWFTLNVGLVAFLLYRRLQHYRLRTASAAV